jgi:exodeoxyribonuclease V alpha subunit
MEGNNDVILKGSVVRVVYRNEESSWTVLELETENELHKVVGVLPLVAAGEILSLSGRWVEHPNFGVQFKAEYFERHLPVGGDAILRYLSSGIIKGVREATAARIVEKFGDRALEIIENQPHRLTEIKGISPARAKKIAEEYAKQFGLREVIITLGSYGLTPNEGLRCWKKWGSATLEKIKSNPYLLCSSGLHIGFERADKISQNLGIAPDDPLRLEAGLIYVLRHNIGNGHTCLPADKLIRVSSALLEVEPDKLEKVLDDMVFTFKLRDEFLDNRRFVFLNRVYNAERYSAEKIFAMLEFPPERVKNLEERINLIEKRLGISYAKQQRAAIRQALEKGILILTGGPGTGKTTTLRAIITLLEEIGHTVAIAAPTGRAAKRISELTGREAKTIHRLLEVKWDDEETQVFDRNENNPLDADAVIVDELSMVDSMLFENLLRALKTGCRLIMVGDSDQLPAVGAGSVLHDLIESDKLPVVQLTEVFRQAMMSNIVSNAHRIVAGRMPVLNYREGDFFFIPKDSIQDVAQTVLELCLSRIPAKYGFTVGDGIQVICPSRKGEIGTREMNIRLQQLINPHTETRREIIIEGTVFRVDDRVMHIKNNYDISWKKDNGEVGQGVFNGDIGILQEINKRANTLSVRFDDRVAVYTLEDAQELELAYAITVHKSQGSEFDAVILPLLNNPPLLCYRNLLYTAVTRAKSLLIIVGGVGTIERMVANDKKAKRYTGLKHFLSPGEKSAFEISRDIH